MKQDAEPPVKYFGIMIIQVVLRVFRTFSCYGTLLLWCHKRKLWLLIQWNMKHRVHTNAYSKKREEVTHKINEHV